MSSEVSTLVIQVNSSQVKDSSKNLDGMTESAGHAEKATDKLKDSVHELVAEYLSLRAIVELGKQIFEVTSEFQSLEAQLRTATGSASAAKEVFDVLREAAAQMPFEVKEVTEAFISLVNKGLDPSMAALKAYGNIATATNQSLTAVTDAVGRAALGQYRGLLELGIKAVEVEDGIVLSFHGTTTKIAKDSKAIQDYIQGLGNNQFAGAMAEQEKTLTGQVHELKDAWNELLYAVSQGGVGELMSEGIRLATDAIKEFTAEIASGQLIGYVKAVGIAFSGWGDDALNAVKMVGEALAAGQKDAENYGVDVAGFLKGAFFNFPENVRAAMQGIGAILAFDVQAVEAAAEAIRHIFALAFVYVVASAVDAGKAIADALKHPFSADGDLAMFFVQQTDLSKKFGTQVDATFTNLDAKLQSASRASDEVITATLDQRDATIKAVGAQISAADQLRLTWDAAAKAKKEAQENKDPLASFKPKTGNTHIQTSEDIAAFESLKKSLQLEEDTIQQSYNRRLNLIKNNTEEGSALRLELTKELEEKVTQEYEKAEQGRFDKVKSIDDQINQAVSDGDYSRVDNLMVTLGLEEDEIKKSYDRRRQQIMTDSKLTEQQRLDQLTKLENEYTGRQKELEVRRTSQVLTASSQLFQSLADIAADSAGKQSALYKVMFAASKAFAIADALVKIQQGIAAAFALPWPANLAAAASVAAATAGIISNITSVAGVFDTGGMIPAGKYGIAGEKGAELVQGPAVITSSRSTADRWGQGGGQPVKVVVNNQSGIEATVNQTSDSDGKVIEILIKQTEAQIASGIKRGGSPLSKAIESIYGQRRGAAS